MKFGGRLIIIWGCMIFYGYGLFMKIDGKVNQALYKEILEGWFFIYNLFL